jgi:hypothetical protein
MGWDSGQGCSAAVTKVRVVTSGRKGSDLGEGTGRWGERGLQEARVRVGRKQPKD